MPTINIEVAFFLTVAWLQYGCYLRFGFIVNPLLSAECLFHLFSQQFVWLARAYSWIPGVRCGSHFGEINIRWLRSSFTSWSFPYMHASVTVNLVCATVCVALGSFGSVTLSRSCHAQCSHPSSWRYYTVTPIGGCIPSLARSPSLSEIDFLPLAYSWAAHAHGAVVAFPCLGSRFFPTTHRG